VPSGKRGRAQMIRYKFIFLLIAVTLFLLPGCYDAQEIDDVVHITTLGIDKGAANSWRLTVQFPSMKDAGSSGGGGSSGDGGGGDGEGEEYSVDGYSIVSIDAPSLFEGLDMLNASIQRRANFSQTHVIVLSEELATTGLRDYISQIIGHFEIRRSAYLLLTKGTAHDFVKANKPFVGSSLMKNYRIWIEQSRVTGYFPYVTLGAFYEDMISSTSQGIITIAAINDFSAFSEEGGEAVKSTPGGGYKAGEVPRIGNNEIELWGTALFNGDIMVAELDGDETRFLLMLRNEFSGGNLSVPKFENSDDIISLSLKKSKPTKVSVKFVDSVPHIKVSVTLKGSLHNAQTSIDIDQESHRTHLEATCQDYIEKRLQQLIEKCQTLNTDVLNLGDAVTKNFLTIRQLIDYDWNSKFKDSAVEVDVNLAIQNTGKLVKNQRIPY
jgi:spore germination protein KC